jgi:hypothetical protein
MLQQLVYSSTCIEPLGHMRSCDWLNKKSSKVPSVPAWLLYRRCADEQHALHTSEASTTRGCRTSVFACLLLGINCSWSTAAATPASDQSASHTDHASIAAIAKTEQYGLCTQKGHLPTPCSCWLMLWTCLAVMGAGQAKAARHRHIVTFDMIAELFDCS